MGNEAKEPPELLMNLITGKHAKSKSFIENIRRYNSMFSFTSLGAKQDMSVTDGRGPYCYRIQGQNYHRMGALLPEANKPPMFAQLYIYDRPNEIQNRISGVRYATYFVNDNFDTHNILNLIIKHELIFISLFYNT